MPETIYPSRFNPEMCPQCGLWMPYRRGVYFDHEKRCYTCRVTWCPDDVAREQWEYSRRLIGVDGDGI